MDRTELIDLFVARCRRYPKTLAHFRSLKGSRTMPVFTDGFPCKPGLRDSVEIPYSDLESALLEAGVGE
jgi:hypothetical protein